MKKTCLILSLMLSAVASISAQDRPRLLDNFNIQGGVTISSPTVAPITPAKKPAVKKTVSSKRMNASEGFAARNANRTRLQMGTGSSLKGFTTGVPAHDKFIEDASRLYRIDPLLIYSQMHQESAFKLRATSHKGASGLMQLMPATARRFGVTKIYDPKQNIHAGVKYMRWLLDTFNGDVVLALAGYNAGEGAVMKYGWNVPPYRETQEYVRRISARYNTISDPKYTRSVTSVTREQAAKLEEKEAAPLTIYDPGIMTIRLPDGRMRLVNQ